MRGLLSELFISPTFDLEVKWMLGCHKQYLLMEGGKEKEEKEKERKGGIYSYTQKHFCSVKLSVELQRKH